MLSGHRAVDSNQSAIKDDPRRQQELSQFVAKLGVTDPTAVRWDLLHQALIDISRSADQNNEVLEFLGDAALRLAAAEFLQATYPHMSVGEMAAVRSQLVSDRTLAVLARDYNFGRYLHISSSAAGDQAGRSSRLADAFEAVLGALYLSTQDLSLIHPWLDRQFERLTQTIKNDPARHNYKAALQELTQAHSKQLPAYTVEEISQRHGDPERFYAQVQYQGKLWGDGKGPSIKQAEQRAAQQAYQQLEPLITVNSNS
ncbi:ribonuclease III [Leptolyngbyaceae cyanobacterium CCMR0082]|uniref:Ribonuclease 3 n=2 Tax=Adonisia turfae TaxID=2950184 RepID=A0A6M0SEH0_9CYAN|nr:ribonuclease III [Adonisia turfae]MDV3352459.1 ribonuclease III [Leptothoe sp. LEGE 181152]NEZ58508.1 ribonuclease III [Adonisia turfae CCMR0081]NEZ66875.1 ribonuclease III [Adonisia turfae CCMR0082]